MGQLLESLKDQAREALRPTDEEIDQKARELFAQKAASVEQRVRDIESNLETARDEQRQINEEIGELDVQG